MRGAPPQGDSCCNYILITAHFAVHWVGFNELNCTCRVSCSAAEREGINKMLRSGRWQIFLAHHGSTKTKECTPLGSLKTIRINTRKLYCVWHTNYDIYKGNNFAVVMVFCYFWPTLFFFFFTNYYPLIIVVQLLAIKEAKQKYQNGIKLVLKNWRTLWREGETFSRKTVQSSCTQRDPSIHPSIHPKPWGRDTWYYLRTCRCLSTMLHLCVHPLSFTMRGNESRLSILNHTESQRHLNKHVAAAAGIKHFIKLSPFICCFARYSTSRVIKNDSVLF